MKKIYIVVTLLSIFALTLSSCGAGTAKDKLAEITSRGYMIISTDPGYPPQSQLVENAERLANTKCPSDTQTANQMEGFDIDVAKAIADKLGVEACFMTVAWELITAGNWANRFDISVGSMSITPERMTKLYFSFPYYITPAAFFVNSANTTYTQPSDLSGKKVGSCSGCTYDSYLNGTLDIPPFGIIKPVVTNIQYSGYETDLYALQDLALGDGVRLDGVLTAQPTGAGAIKDGLAIKQLGEPVFVEYLAAAIDKASSLDPASFLNKVTEIIKGLHSDGTLLSLSKQYYGEDLTTQASSYDWTALKQLP